MMRVSIKTDLQCHEAIEILFLKSSILSNLLNDSQCAFGHNRSASIALIKLSEVISSLLDRKLTIISMLIDIKKAFDTIYHNILITKAENMGLRGIVINKLGNYLYNRKQYVEFSNNKSSLRDVVCCVSQRSIFLLSYL